MSEKKKTVPPKAEEKSSRIPEGVPGADKLNELIERGKKKGRLTATEMMELDGVDLDSEVLDKFYEICENSGIDLVADEDIVDVDASEPTEEEIKDISEEEVVDPNTLVDNFGIDDPVRMYLKEIGKVPLLTPEQETELAKGMSAGFEAQAILDEAKKNGEELPPDVVAELEKTIKKGEHCKQSLSEANLRLVVSIAKRYVGRG
ncbi:MAG: RNA polymerase sigma factor RpoD, partial [Clostridiales bacterium]|nr:RNA polymerase sigma factor RpoD [Clostridiales bacterium]